jgi:hypothetical protein
MDLGTKLALACGHVNTSAWLIVDASLMSVDWRLCDTKARCRSPERSIRW